MIGPECTCSEDRQGGDPEDHSGTCAWAGWALMGDRPADHEAERFALFAYEDYYPRGGINDLVKVIEGDEATARLEVTKWLAEQKVVFSLGEWQLVSLPDLNLVAEAEISR